MKLSQHHRTGNFLLSEDRGSRTFGTVALGQVLEAGTVLMRDSSGYLVAYAAGDDSGGAETAAGVLLHYVDASSAPQRCSYICADASMNMDLLVIPAGDLARQRTAEALGRLSISVVPSVAPPVHSSGGGGSAYTGPLDLVSGVWAAYGQRALSAAMLGQPLYTIRRSGDSATQSFPSDAATGDAPVVGIETFIDGGSGFIATWNDQSGHGYDVQQPTTAKQPTWVGSWSNSRPAILGTQTQLLVTAGDVTYPAPGAFTIFAVLQLTARSIYDHDVVGMNASDSENNGPLWVVHINQPFQHPENTRIESVGYNFNEDQGNGIGGSPSAVIGSTVISAPSLVEIVWGPNAISPAFNGAAVAGGVDQSYGGGDLGDQTWPLAVMAADAVNPPTCLDGNIAELLIYPTILSDADRVAIRQNIATHYGITLA